MIIGILPECVRSVGGLSILQFFYEFVVSSGKGRAVAPEVLWCGREFVSSHVDRGLIWDEFFDSVLAVCD